MSMPLLYNIEKFNNTVIIQSSVSMYTDVYSILLFSITKGATKPVSSDLKIHPRPLSSRGMFGSLSARVFSLSVSLASCCRLSTRTEEYTCYSNLCCIHVWIHAASVNTCNNALLH